MRQLPVVSLLIIWLSILCALLLQIMPLPPFIDAFRPNWVLLVGLYWSIALPTRFNLGSAWLSGLVLDLIWGSPLGINALAFVLVHSASVVHFKKIRSFSIWQQALLIAIISAIYQFFSYIFESWLNDVLIPDGYYFSSLTALIVWPWLFLILRKTRRHWHIS